MCFKNKMIAAVLCAIVAGIGIFGIGGNTASATATSTASAGYSALGIEQLQKIVESLIQQIQQLRQMIAELKPLETCGNGKCRFGETATSCAADCAGSSVCAQEGQTRYSTGNLLKCCNGLIPISYYETGRGENLSCAKCGNGICSVGENQTNCAADCDVTTASCAAEGEDVLANKPCCSGLTALNSCTKGSCSYSLPKKCAACGNGICGKGETSQNCPQDCKYEKMTCAQACAQEGYSSAASYCNTWTLLPGQSLASTCAANEFGAGTTQDCNKNRVSGAYSDTTCCCNKQSAVSISVSANSLPSKYVYAGDQKALIYSLNILANGSDMDVQRVTLQFSGAPYKYLGNIYLYNGNTLLTSSPLNSGTVSTVSTFDHEITLSNFSNKFVISKGTTGRLDIKADVISPLAGVGAIAKMYVITAPDGIRAVGQSNVNYYGSEPSETMGSMMIISNKPTCGNNVCEAEASESAINCSADCRTCKTLWWTDNKTKICQQGQFCGTYMYSSLKTYDTQSACQAALDATCSMDCKAKGYALGGNYCVANEQGILETCCCTGTILN